MDTSDKSDNVSRTPTPARVSPSTLLALTGKSDNPDKGIAGNRVIKTFLYNVKYSIKLILVLQVA